MVPEFFCGSQALHGLRLSFKGGAIFCTTLPPRLYSLVLEERHTLYIYFLWSAPKGGCEIRRREQSWEEAPSNRPHSRCTRRSRAHTIRLPPRFWTRRFTPVTFLESFVLPRTLFVTDTIWYQEITQALSPRVRVDQFSFDRLAGG